MNYSSDMTEIDEKVYGVRDVRISEEDIYILQTKEKVNIVQTDVNHKTNLRCNLPIKFLQSIFIVYYKLYIDISWIFC